MVLQIFSFLLYLLDLDCLDLLVVNFIGEGFKPLGKLRECMGEMTISKLLIKVSL